MLGLAELRIAWGEEFLGAETCEASNEERYLFDNRIPNRKTNSVEKATGGPEEESSRCFLMCAVNGVED
jgi:hypothetical protein